MGVLDPFQSNINLQVYEPLIRVMYNVYIGLFKMFSHWILLLFGNVPFTV